jgi:hypothetical protein
MPPMVRALTSGDLADEQTFRLTPVVYVFDEANMRRETRVLFEMDLAAAHDPPLPRLVDVVMIEAVHDAVGARCCRADRAEEVNRPFAGVVVVTRQPDVTGTVDVPDVRDLIPEVRLIGKEPFDRRPPFTIFLLRILVVVDREVPAKSTPSRATRTSPDFASMVAAKPCHPAR